MGTYKAFKTDESLEQAGIVLDFGEAGKFTIARAGGANKRLQKVLARLTKPYRQAIQVGALDEATSDKIVLESFAEAVVLGWEGVTGADGKELPFTKENAVKLFTDLPDLFGHIRRNAENAALFRQFINEADIKN